MSMKDWRDHSLLARQTEAVKQMLALNQVSSVSVFLKPLCRLIEIENDVFIHFRPLQMELQVGKF